MSAEKNQSQWWTPTARFFIVTAGIVITIAGLLVASPIIAPLLLAIFLTLLINPMLNWLRAKGLPNWLAFLTLAAGIIIVGAVIVLFISASLNSLSQNVPVYQQNLAKLTSSLQSYLNSLGINVAEFSISNAINPQALASAAVSLLSILISQLSIVVLALLLFIFLLAEAPEFPAKAVRAFGADSPIVLRLATFGRAVVTFTKVLTLTNLFVGVVWGVLLIALGVDAALLWAFLAFILQYIPTIGLIIASVPAIIVALLGEGPTTAAIVTLGVIIINSISANVIAPRFSAKELELSTAVVFFSFIFWSWLFGAIGAVLSVILTVGVKSILEGFPEGQRFAIILGPELRKEPVKPEKKEAA